MITQLELWLKQATRHLSKDSAAQVRTEIREHYESARESALSGGVNDREADRIAVMALGNPKAANRQYRTVLLTSAEAKMLRDAKWEGRAVCSRAWLRRVLLAVPVTFLLAALAFLLSGNAGVARVLLVAGVSTGFYFVGPFLPIYTPSRGRMFRLLKWIVLFSMPALAFGPNAGKMSWLLISSLTPLLWIEWTRASIRRKLPLTQWPKALYL